MNFIRKASKNTPLRAFLSFLIFTCSANVAMATTYDCDTDQMLQWKSGRLQSNSTLKHQTIRFNDETGMLWWAFSPSSPFLSKQLNILQQGGSDSDLVASSVKLDGNFVNDEIFHIRTWDKKAGIIFLYYSSPDNVSTGKCHIGEPYP